MPRKKVPCKPVPYVPQSEDYQPILKEKRGNGRKPSGYVSLATPEPCSGIVEEIRPSESARPISSRAANIALMAAVVFGGGSWLTRPPLTRSEMKEEPPMT